jgi:protein-export membrane protein SecD
MNRSWQILALILVCAVSGAYFLTDALPPALRHALPKWLPFKHYYTIEQQGGSVIVLQMDTAALRESWLNALRDDVRRELRGMRDGAKAEPLGYEALEIKDGAVRAVLREAADMDKVLPRLKAMPGAQDLAIEPDGGTAVTLKYTEVVSYRRIGEAMESAAAVFRRRVAELDRREPVVSRQGLDRILVQVPGAADPAPLARLLGVTARLGFHLVDQSMTAAEASSGRRPVGTVLYESADPSYPGPYLVKREALLTGDDMAEVRGEIDSYSSQGAVAFRLTPAGARKFAQVTRDNVGKPFAIVIDGKVLSAPVIREPIIGGSGIISGNFTLQSASELAAQLRAGALPAPFAVTEARYQPPQPPR